MTLYHSLIIQIKWHVAWVSDQTLLPCHVSALMIISLLDWQKLRSTMVRIRRIVGLLPLLLFPGRFHCEAVPAPFLRGLLSKPGAARWAHSEWESRADFILMGPKCTTITGISMHRRLTPHWMFWITASEGHSNQSRQILTLDSMHAEFSVWSLAKTMSTGMQING